MQLIKRGTTILTCSGHIVAHIDPKRAKAVLLAQGCTAAAADAIAQGYAVLSDPFPTREWKFNTKER